MKYIYPPSIPFGYLWREGRKDTKEERREKGVHLCAYHSKLEQLKVNCFNPPPLNDALSVHVVS